MKLPVLAQCAISAAFWLGMAIASYRGPETWLGDLYPYLYLGGMAVILGGLCWHSAPQQHHEQRDHEPAALR